MPAHKAPIKIEQGAAFDQIFARNAPSACATQLAYRRAAAHTCGATRSTERLHRWRPKT